MRLMSFDVSSVSTGWSFFKVNDLEDFGVISRARSESVAADLFIFKKRVVSVLRKCKPNEVVIEETYMKNVKTLKMLMQFIGIVQVSCFELLQVTPSFVHPASVRSMFKLKDKEAVFNFVKDMYGSRLNNCIFNLPKGKNPKKYIVDHNFIVGNDITDSILQGLYWIKKENSNE